MNPALKPAGLIAPDQRGPLGQQPSHQPSQAYMQLPKKRPDLVYLTPAVLCSLAFLAGVIPCLLCLQGIYFVYISLTIFMFSIIAHIYILFQWRRYQDASPLGYAMIQPALHLVLLTFALLVGSTNICVPPQHTVDPSAFKHKTIYPYDLAMSEAVAEEQKISPIKTLSE